MITRRRLLASATAALAAAAPPVRRPNVLIILADDLGYHDLGYLGGDIRTPNLDRLASQGMRFLRSYSFPYCSAGRAALLTGRAPIRLGLGYVPLRPWSTYGIPSSEILLSEAFGAAGYQTAITGKWHLGHARRRFLPHARGFDLAYGHLNGATDYFTHEREGGLDWHRNGRSLREEGYSSFLIANEACRFIRDRDPARPFFLYAPFNAPHTPLQAPRDFLANYSNVRDANRRTYSAMVSALDQSIGRILATLDDQRIASDTLVLFLSDNGGATQAGANNLPLRSRKGTCFEGGIRVPAILRFPGRVKPNSRSRQVVTVMDVFPTLIAAAGFATAGHKPFDGENLWPLIVTGRTSRRNDLFFSSNVGGLDQFALLSGEWKLVVTEAPHIAPRLNLFNIDEDPIEASDLFSSNSSVAQILLRRLNTWRKLHPPTGLRNIDRPAGWKAPPLWAEAALPG